MSSVSADVEVVRRMVRPIAVKVAGPILAPRIMAGMTAENLRAAYAAVGAEGIHAAAAALVRIGQRSTEDEGGDER